MDQDGPRWTKMDKDGQRWTKMNQDGPCKITAILSKIEQKLVTISESVNQIKKYRAPFGAKNSGYILTLTITITIDLTLKT